MVFTDDCTYYTIITNNDCCGENKKVISIDVIHTKFDNTKVAIILLLEFFVQNDTRFNDYV